jgi:hypothetical protein
VAARLPRKGPKEIDGDEVKAISVAAIRIGLTQADETELRRRCRRLDARTVADTWELAGQNAEGLPRESISEILKR